jgi:hypothetical protein
MRYVFGLTALLLARVALADCGDLQQQLTAATATVQTLQGKLGANSPQGQIASLTEQIQRAFRQLRQTDEAEATLKIRAQIKDLRHQLAPLKAEARREPGPDQQQLKEQMAFIQNLVKQLKAGGCPTAPATPPSASTLPPDL